MSKFIYQEVPLEAVLQFYANHFEEKTQDGEPRKLHRHLNGNVYQESFVDPVKGRVVFKLALSESRDV